MVGTFDPGVFRAFRPPMFCRQSFATGSVRFQAGEVYDGADPAVAGNAQFFTADIPSVLGDMRDLHGGASVEEAEAGGGAARKAG